MTTIIISLLLAAIVNLSCCLWWVNRKLNNISDRLFDAEVQLSNLENRTQEESH